MKLSKNSVSKRRDAGEVVKIQSEKTRPLRILTATQSNEVLVQQQVSTERISLLVNNCAHVCVCVLIYV